jgi:hypothetical protein
LQDLSLCLHTPIFTTPAQILEWSSFAGSEQEFLCTRRTRTRADPAIAHQNMKMHQQELKENAKSVRIKKNQRKLGIHYENYKGNSLNCKICHCVCTRLLLQLLARSQNGSHLRDLSRSSCAHDARAPVQILQLHSTTWTCISRNSKRIRNRKELKRTNEN